MHTEDKKNSKTKCCSCTVVAQGVNTCMTCGDAHRTKCFDGISNSVFCRTQLYRLFSTAAQKGLGGESTVGVCFYMFGV